MKTQHTPGPWHVSRDGRYVRFTQSDGTSPNICNLDVFVELNEGEQAANAALIASAPELLAALRGLVEHIEACEESDLLACDGDPHPPSVFSVLAEEARAALASATPQATGG